MSRDLIGIGIGITAVILLAAVVAPIAIPDFNSNILPYAEYTSTILSSLALFWVVINSILQRRELSMHRDILGRTASATFSQFYSMYYDELQRALNRICHRIIIFSNIPILGEIKPEERLDNAYITALTSYPSLHGHLVRSLNEDIGDVLREQMQEYIYVFEKLESLATQQSADESTREMLSVIVAANPMAQLRTTITSALNSPDGASS